MVDEASGELDADSQPLDVILAEANDRQMKAEAFEYAAVGIPLILLFRDPPADCTDALRQGARAVLSSNAAGPQIAAAIEAVLAGLVVIDSDEIGQVAPLRTFNERLERLAEDLTPRETEILRAIDLGLANKEIAGRLGISENTVKFHIASIMGKLGAASRTEAVMIGIRHGIVLI